MNQSLSKRKRTEEEKREQHREECRQSRARKRAKVGAIQQDNAALRCFITTTSVGVQQVRETQQKLQAEQQRITAAWESIEKQTQLLVERQGHIQEREEWVNKMITGVQQAKEKEKRLQKKEEELDQDYQARSAELEMREREIAERVDTERINTLIMNNLVTVLQKLNHNCPFRRPLIGEISKGLELEEIKRCFQVSDTTARRAINERDQPTTDSGLWNIKYKPKSKRRRYQQAREQLVEVLNDLAPKPSARDYRICTTTKGKFYEDYLASLPEGEHRFSKRFLIDKFLGRHHGVAREQHEGERIQWVKDASMCKHCRRRDELMAKAKTKKLSKKEKEELKQANLHHALIQAQRGEYLNIKHDLAAGKMAEGTILIVQDFTQLNTTKGGFWQDLIIVWFEYKDGVQQS